MTEVDFRLADQEYDPAIPVEAISEHPDNPNDGDIGAISQSMDSHGFFGAVLIQKSTGHILAGNHRYRTARAKGAPTLPGFWLDVDDGEAEEILAVDNRTAALASVDEARLVALLTRRAASPRGLTGTGYDGDDLDDMIRMLQPPDLDQLGDGLGDPGEEDGWPTISIRAPRVVAAAWNDHCKGHGDDGAVALAALLGCGWQRGAA